MNDRAQEPDGIQGTTGTRDTSRPEESDHAEELERRIGELRAAIRLATRDGDGVRVRRLRDELRQAERDWDEALETAGTHAVNTPADRDGARDDAGGHDRLPDGPSLLPLREQVYEALSLLAVPAAPRLISTVHEAFFTSTFPSAKLTSLKRDEERSFRAAPFARPFYLCPALTAEFLSPSRGLLAISTWPLEKRVIGPLSPRVDFLTAAINVAAAVERIPEPPVPARRLLWRFAASIPGAADSSGARSGAGGRSGAGARDSSALVRPQQVIEAAEAELGVHTDQDTRVRKAAAARARKQLDPAGQLFGTRLARAAAGPGAEAG